MQLPGREELQRELNRCRSRIRQLEDTYAALVIAQRTLAEASQDLQRRFAPRITGRARELMKDFTGGRYDRLQLGEELDVWAGAGEEEEGLHRLGQIREDIAAYIREHYTEELSMQDVARAMNYSDAYFCKLFK
jgi:hypothetical protein